MTILVALKGFALGSVGSDAGYWWIGPDGKPVHVGGWGEREKAEVTSALTLLAAAGQIQDHAVQNKVLGLVQTMLAPNMEYLEKGSQGVRAAAE